MKRRRLILIVLAGTVWLAVSCNDQPSLIPTETIITVQPSDTPEPTKAVSLPPPTPTESRPTWLPVPPENQNVIKLTDNTDWRNVKPVWSPDGSQILFMSNRECEKSHLDSELERYLLPSCWEWDLYLMDADGNNEIRLTDVQFVDGWDGAWLRWSPNGERIAFTFAKYLDTPFQKVYTFPLDQAKQKPLGLNDMEVLVDEGEDYFIGSFEWSPDGKKYAYDYFSSHEVPPRRYDIVVVDFENGEEVFRKTTTGDTLCEFGAWSPYGEEILISCVQESDWKHQLDLVDLDTGVQRLLIENAMEPAWSPDGRWILFNSTETSRAEIFHVESGEVIPFEFPDDVYFIFIWNWSPDGKWVAYDKIDYDDSYSPTNIYLMDMSWLEE